MKFRLLILLTFLSISVTAQRTWTSYGSNGIQRSTVPDTLFRSNGGASGFVYWRSDWYNKQVFPLDANLVHKTGNETIYGSKSFMDSVKIGTTTGVGEQINLLINGVTKTAGTGRGVEVYNHFNGDYGSTAISAKEFIDGTTNRSHQNAIQSLINKTGTAHVDYASGIFISKNFSNNNVDRFYGLYYNSGTGGGAKNWSAYLIGEPLYTNSKIGISDDEVDDTQMVTPLYVSKPYQEGIYGIEKSHIGAFSNNASGNGVGGVIALGGKTGLASPLISFGYIKGSPEYSGSNYGGELSFYTTSDGSNSGEVNSGNYKRLSINSKGRVLIGMGDNGADIFQANGSAYLAGRLQFGANGFLKTGATYQFLVNDASDNSILHHDATNLYSRGNIYAGGNGFNSGDRVLTETSPVLLGSPTSTTPPSADNSTRIATTNYVTNAISTASSSYVPYTGATTSLNLGINNITANQASFSRTSTLSFVANISTPLTSNTTVNDSGSEYTLPFDATSGNITVTLPTASAPFGRILVIKKLDASANTVTIDPPGSITIDGALTYVLSSVNSSVTIQSLGTSNGWKIISSHQDPTLSNVIEVTGTSQTAIAGKVYQTLNAAMTTVTLPSTAVNGATVIVNGIGAGKWRIQQGNAGDLIKGVGGFTTLAGATHGVETSDQFGTLSLRYNLTTTTWVVTSQNGSIAAY